MGVSTVLSLLSEFKSGNRKVADFIEETIENAAKKSDLKSIISMDEASLRAAALLSDERIKEGRAGRLEGLPLIIKDNIDTSPTGVGARGDETTHKVASRGFVRRELKVVSGDTSNVTLMPQTTSLKENKVEINSDDTTAVINETKAPNLAQEIEAKIKGYEGEACGECGNFTLVRNGTCMKCNTCGATSGCS